MHNAPSVTYPVGRCLFVCVVLSAVASFAVLLQAGAFWSWWPVGVWVAWKFVLFFGLWVFVLSWAFVFWWRLPTGWLMWDPVLTSADFGATVETFLQPESGGWLWCVSTALKGQTVKKVQSMWLGQRWALLCVHLVQEQPPRGCIWLCVLERSAPERWLPLRRALLKHAG